MTTSFGFAQANVNCADMEAICTDGGLNFTANTGVANASVLDPGNNYDCLFSQPNPAWYYLEISTAGDVNMNLYAPQDIDFIIWGPFTDLATAQGQCGNLGNGGAGGNVVDCSYSGTNNEFPNIYGAQVGEVYVMLITNYANTVQDLTLQQVGGTGETDCSIVQPDPCVSDPGTFVIKKNGVTTTSPVYICEGEDFSIESNGDYILPNDTIPQPVGDGVYSAQLMYLVYSSLPIIDPATDPGWTGMIVPADDIFDSNDGASPIVNTFGCGTFWFVPVAGDDGVGGNGNVANGTNDNGGLHWDKNGNGCYLLGAPIEVTYACEMTVTPTLNCNPPTTINGVDLTINGGSGAYTVVNLGDGNLSATNVPNGGTTTVANLENAEVWEILVTDAEGCTTTETGVFAAPVISNITITPAVTCPSASNGQVDVTVAGTSGAGGPYTIVMAGDPPTVGTTDSYANIAGTIVPIVVADAAGCISDSTVTITSSGHFIDVQITSIQDEFCYGDLQGAATISAVPTPTGTVTSITWTNPLGVDFPGGATNTSQSGMMPGCWSVTVIDNVGCEVTIPVCIDSPQELDVYVSNSNEPVCYGYSDGSITVQSTGGSGGNEYSWNPTNPIISNTYNNAPAGTYTAYVTDDNGCMDSIQFVLGQPDSLWADFTIKDVLCYGGNNGGIIVDTVYNAAGNISYYWNLQGVVPNPPSTSSVASGLTIGTYVLTIQDEFCDNQYEITISQNPELVFTEFDYEPAYCRMFSYQSGNGVVSAAATGGVASYAYEWLNVGTGQTSNNTTWGGLNPGTYQMTVTDAVGCTLVETIVLDSVNPIAAFTATSDDFYAPLEGTAPVCVDFTNESQYFANPNNPAADTTFFWQLGYPEMPWQITHDYNQIMDTCYYAEAIHEVCLVAINKNGCTDTACVEIIVHDQPTMPTPNIFTPGANGSGDGKNDVFTFEYFQIGITDENFECVIVDRWGTVVKTMTSVTDSWNGNNDKGNPCNDGVYFYTYKATSTNGTVFEGQGTITLVREQ